MKNNGRHFISDKVQNPNEVVICIVLIALIAVICCAMLVVVIVTSQLKEEEMSFAEVTFYETRLSGDEKELELFSEDYEDKFVINIKYLSDKNELKSKTPYSVWYIHEEKKDTKPCNVIYQIRTEEKMICSLEKARKVNESPGITFFSSALFVILLLMSFSLAIAHSPEKFPRKFINFFYKPGVI